MILCPNLSNPQVKKEFDELVSVLGENTAYYVWDQNNGYSLDYAPNGAQSKLFSDLFNYYNDRNKAIKAKARTLSKEFKQWFQGSKTIDKNGEPILVYHGTSKEHYGFQVVDVSKSDDKISFFASDQYTTSSSYVNKYETNINQKYDPYEHTLDSIEK